MRRILICSGVLGVGTALVFAAAALTATLFPNGTLVSAGWNGGGMWDRGWGVAVPMPMPGQMAPDVVWEVEAGEVAVDREEVVQDLAPAP